jgi:sigma-E factor negative regulatory protein RseB
VGDALAGLSERALNALAASYQLRLGGRESVAGRLATVVIARRDGLDLARLWLDDATGLLLREDVVDHTGRPLRAATFRSLRLDPQPAAQSTVQSTAQPADLVAADPTTSQAQTGAWSEVDEAALARWRAAGWPCPQRLAAGFVLLDIRRGTASTGAPVLQLTYGDGLSAVSVFLQRGRLDDSRLTGLTHRKWGDVAVLVRDGVPEVLVWQGGPTVITAVGDAGAADLQAILSPLPRQPDRGSLESLQQKLGSALAWFGG